MTTLLIIALLLQAPAASQDSGSIPYYVLDGYGVIWAGNGAPPLHGLPYWGDDFFIEMTLTKVECSPTGIRHVEAYVLDTLGGVWQVRTDNTGFEAPQLVNDPPLIPPYDIYVRIGDGDETPFFGFDAARDIVALSNVWRGCG